MKIKSAEELLDEHQIHLDRSLYNSQDIEIPVVELMKEYAKQFIDLAIAKSELEDNVQYFGECCLDKESILKVKQLIK